MRERRSSYWSQNKFVLRPMDFRLVCGTTAHSFVCTMYVLCLENMKTVGVTRVMTRVTRKSV